MIKQYLTKYKKIAKGIYNTYLKSKGQNYNDSEWWDKSFYTAGVSDRQTISPKKSLISSKYHYCSVELQILKHFYNHNIETKGVSLLDIGSGSGHWIDFYQSLGFQKAVGIDVSKFSVNHLRTKYPNNPNIRFYEGRAIDILDQLESPFHIVNAIGVMFHIVNDSEWSGTINKLAGLIPKKGVFIAGGHFGMLNGLNVQIDRNGQINKRLRSKASWKKTLKRAGFSDVKIYRNTAYLWINDTLPENNILVATKQ